MRFTFSYNRLRFLVSNFFCLLTKVFLGLAHLIDLKFFVKLYLMTSKGFFCLKIFFIFQSNKMRHKIIFICTLLVCLFIGTNRAQIFCGTSHVPREGLQKIKISKICLENSIIIIFLKIREIFLFFVLQCIQRENVHKIK